MDNKQTIQILLAEDHELARYGLVLTLESKEGIKVIGEAENGKQAIEMAQSLKPDVILMDIGMPVMDGITATRELKQSNPDIKIVMLTSHKDQEEVIASLSAGADAYCMKDIKIDRLCQILEMVLDGAVWLDPAVADVVLRSLGNPAAPHVSAEAEASQPEKQHHTRRRYNTELTDREMEVLKLIVGGKSNKEIALAINVTTHTVKAHVANIIQKLSVDDRTQAAVKALQEGIITY